MKRYRYGFNRQTINMADTAKVFPLGYVEVAPGETVQGSVAAKVTSDVTVRAIYTRAYMDAMAFYIPYRLLDDGWVDFITTGVGAVPTVANAFTLNFEPRAAAHPAFFRRAYNLIWNSFYRTQSQIDLGFTATPDQNAELYASYRKSDWYSSLNDGALYTETNVPLTEGTPNVLKVSDIRDSMAQDRIKRLRAWYGTKYTDYLGSVGVEANWSVLEEPEIIGRKSIDLTYRTTKGTYQADTGGTPLAAPGGAFEAFCTVPIRRTFVPEHGLICVFAVNRLERYNAHAQDPSLIKDNRKQYWDPMFEQHSFVDWPPGATLGSGSGELIKMPPFEDYRKGANLVAYQAGADPTDVYGVIHNTTPMTIVNYQVPPPDVFDSLFQGDLGAHFQCVNTWRLIRNSPIKPDPRYGVA